MTAGRRLGPASRLRSLARRVLPRRALAAVHGARQRRRYDRFPARVVVRTYAGEPLRLRIADPVAEAWYDRDWEEPRELRLLRSGRLVPGARVFDLGAHQAVVALLLARAVGPEGRVVAVEAGPHEVEVARENLALNGASNVELLHAAVAAERGTVAFGLDGEVAHGSGAWPTVEVEALSVDDLADRHGPPDVLFVDVEGFEGEALAGASRTLARRPDVFVEVHGEEQLGRFGASVADVLSYFPEAEYELLAAESDDDEFRPLDRSRAPSERFFLVARARAA